MFFIYILLFFLLSLLFSLTRDFYISLYYCIKNKRDPMSNFYGMIGFCGYYGEGKSMALTHTINSYKKIAKKNGVDLKIYTNYYYKNQTGALSCLDDIEKICDEKRKNNDDSYVLFAIDELQNALNSRQWNDTKKLESLLPIFTMTRKLKVMFLYTSPVLSMSDKTIRISSKAIYLCKKINRYFFVRWKLNPVELEGGQLKELKLSFIPTAHSLLDNELANSYDSYAFIETLQKQDYMKHNELETIQLGNTVIKINNKK